MVSILLPHPSVAMKLTSMTGARESLKNHATTGSPAGIRRRGTTPLSKPGCQESWDEARNTRLCPWAGVIQTGRSYRPRKRSLWPCSYSRNHPTPEKVTVTVEQVIPVPE